MKTLPDDSAFAERVQQLHHSIVPADCTAGLGASARQDRALLEQLLVSLREQFPAAGHRYWSTRLWLLATWQACYLSVAAVDENRVLNFSQLCQAVRNNSVYGFDFTEMPDCGAGDRVANLRANAEGLRAFVDRCFDAVNNTIKLCRANSYGLIADTLNLALIRAYQLQHGAVLLRDSQLWAQSAALTDRHGIALSHIRFRQRQPQLLRASCCRHHLTGYDAALYCKDCPLIRRRLKTTAPANTENKVLTHELKPYPHTRY